MQKSALALGSLLAALSVGPAAQGATSGTCTISNVGPRVEAGGPGPLALPPFGGADGFAMPVTFDETTGAFSMNQAAWAAAFPNGVGNDTGFGGNATEILSMPQAVTVTGTIDSAGDITLPGFPLTLGTAFCPPPNNSYPIVANFDSAPQFLTLGPAPVEVQGAALNFTTGQVSLKGAGLIPGTCATGPIITSVTMTCTLAPIPDRTKLPAPPTLTKVSGSGRIGKPLPATQPSKPAKGDVLSLAAQLSPGGMSFDFTANVFLSLTGSNGKALVTVEIPAGSLSPKGKGYQVVDSSGTVIAVLAGQKANGAVLATTGGTVRFKRGKKGFALQAHLQGLDLSTLSGAGQMAVAVGPYTATAPFTATGKGKSRRLR
ncbi:MAG TPA: hypothetical protein VKW76_17365 [Candidatus Binatia bacterium]|nr:hypothetical protein [Candidatus Binatia bacterium]